MTLKKLSAVLTLAAIFFCARLARAEEAYILTVPETFSVKTNGWNLIGRLQVQRNGDNSFSSYKKLVVTASSDNEFALKDGDNAISYTLKAASSDESKTDTWEFSATEINAGTSKDIGIYITWESTQAAGNYSDTITYTVKVEDIPPTFKRMSYENVNFQGVPSNFKSCTLEQAQAYGEALTDNPTVYWFVVYARDGDTYKWVAKGSSGIKSGSNTDWDMVYNIDMYVCPNPNTQLTVYFPVSSN